MHKADDPRNYVGDVVEAAETDEELAIKGGFDLGTEHGMAAYRNVKGRRVSGLSIGYAIRNSTKTAAGNELTDLRHDSPQCAHLCRRLQSLVDDRHKLIEQLLR